MSYRTVAYDPLQDWVAVRVVLAFAVLTSLVLGFAASRILLAAGPVPKFHEVVDSGSQVLVLESPSGEFAYFKVGDRHYRLRLENAL